MSKATLGAGAGLVGPVFVEPGKDPQEDPLRASEQPADSGEIARHTTAITDIAKQTGLIGASANELIIDAQNREKERILNAGCDRETILRNNLCEQILLSEDLQEAFKNLRRGYPDRPFAEQCHGQEFRENADKIIDAIAEHTLRNLDPKKVVVMMPWRAGLAFSRSYQQRGVDKFYHVSSRRDEETLETMVDFESGQVGEGDTVIMADPMLATGNTAVDAFQRIMASGIAPENIIVNAVVAAPVGVQAIKRRCPAIRVVTGALDDKLDHRGYIVLGLGDFGDKYFGNFTRQQVEAIADALKFGALPRRKLTERFQLHAE